VNLQRALPLVGPVPVIARTLMPCLLLLIITGCASGRQFFYNRLPTVLPWYLERYVDLDSAQETRFDEQLAELLAWHRSVELPRYVALIAELEIRLQSPLQAADIAAVSDDIEVAWYRLRDRALEELLVLGASLSEAQIDEFLEHLEKRQRKYQDKYLERSDDRFREDAADDLRDSLEDYLGRLQPAQRTMVDDAVARLRRSDSAWIEERRRWIDTLRRELEREAGWQVRIRQAVVGWEDTLDAGTAAIYDHNTAVIEGAIADVVDARSERQDERLRSELAALREDLAALAAQATEAP
jgi:hypothetical protein